MAWWVIKILSLEKFKEEMWIRTTQLCHLPPNPWVSLLRPQRLNNVECTLRAGGLHGVLFLGEIFWRRWYLRGILKYGNDGDGKKGEDLALSALRMTLTKVQDKISKSYAHLSWLVSLLLVFFCCLWQDVSSSIIAFTRFLLNKSNASQKNTETL